jgi:rhomboid protease GluP
MPANSPPENPASFIDRLRLQTPRIPATVTLIVANLLVFVAMLGFGAGLWHSPNNIQLEWGANFGPATEDGEWWRLGSALFLHFGLLHLATNMLALADAGHLAERMFGYARFTAIYFASGITGNLLSLVVHGDLAVSGGASGAIFGIYGAMLVYLALHRRHLQRHEFRWLFWGATAFSTFTIVFGILVPGIDNAAHLGGLLAGVLAGFAMAPAPNPSSRRGQYGRALASVAWFAIVSGLAAAIPEPRYRWREEQRAQGQINEFLAADRQISANWNAIMEQGKAGGQSFEQLAAQLESDVASKYASSVDQLATLHLDSTAPSAPALDFVRNYAELRRDASQALVDGLRQDDRQKIRAAIELAKGLSAGSATGSATKARQP